MNDFTKFLENQQPCYYHNKAAGSGFDVNNNPLYIDTTDNVKNKLNSGSISKGIVAAIHYQFIADNGWFVKDSSGNVAERWDFKELVDKGYCPCCYCFSY